MAPAERVIVPTSVASGGGTVISSPFQFALDGADNLRLRVWAKNIAGTGAIQGSVALMFRTVDTAGQIQVTTRAVTPADDSTSRAFTFGLPRGFLLNLTVAFAATGTFAGLCYVAVDLIRGLPPGSVTQVGQLLGGYIRPGAALTWPGSPVMSSVEGRGFPRTVETLLHDIGADLNIVSPILSRWLVLAAHAVLFTDATPANRVVGLNIVDAGGLTLGLCPAPDFTPASSAMRITWQNSAPQPSVAGIGWTVGVIPAGLIVTGGTTFMTVTSGLQATDQFTVFHVRVEEWLEANV